MAGPEENPGVSLFHLVQTYNCLRGCWIVFVLFMLVRDLEILQAVMGLTVS